MLKHPGNQIGDAWFFVHQSTAHCFYLTCPVGVERHRYWDVGHAVSTDMVHWDIVGLALTRGGSGEWDEGCLATGSVIRFADRFYMAYTGHLVAKVGIAVSDDLECWTKLPENPVTTLAPQHYEPIGSGVRQVRHWRDPFLFEHDGCVYHFVCASRRTGPADGRGTVGLAETSDMIHWNVLPPPEIEPVAQELECPQLCRSEDTCYLVFSSGTDWFSKAFLSRHGRGELGWTTYSMVGPSPFGPFRMVGSGRILPPDYGVQPYACQIVVWQGRPCLLGTVRQPDGDLICDPILVEFRDDGVRLRA